MALLHKLDGLADRLRHVQTHHDDWQAASNCVLKGKSVGEGKLREKRRHLPALLPFASQEEARGTSPPHWNVKPHRQKADAVIVSQSARLFVVVMIPIV